MISFSTKELSVSKLTLLWTGIHKTIQTHTNTFNVYRILNSDVYSHREITLYAYTVEGPLSLYFSLPFSVCLSFSSSLAPLYSRALYVWVCVSVCDERI